jgi:hypothetical protein
MTLRLNLLLLLAWAQHLVAQPWPSVQIVAPVHGQTFSSGFVTFAADGNDLDGFVAEVRYFVNNVYYGTGFPPSFELPVFVNNGRHAVHAVAYDDVGYYTAASPIYFQVGGELPVNVLRWPYLQSCSSTSIVVRWRTDWPTNSVVRYGLTFPGTDFGVTNVTRTSEHAVLVNGLTPGTEYYYSIHSATEAFASRGPFSFRTAPTNTRPVTVWVIGDSGTANTNAEAVRDAYLDSIGVANTDLWLMLGDNAYESGTDEEYNAAVFNMYPDILARVPLWPTIGNHDAALPYQFPYLDIFHLPRNGEAGGLPSGTERYYSFDYANIHFICLDSQTSSRATNGPMLTWLQEDLSATDKDWIVAYWHHPPYSKGSHNSDTELQLIEMREWALPILEAYGVDLVLSGHSHVYERSFLLNGHYGNTNSFSTSMVVDSGLGNTAENPYRKPAGGLGAHSGTVYAVCGCSGEGGSNSFFFGRHPAMARSLDYLGSMVLRFNDLRLEAQFLRPGGDIDDSFIIDKSAPTSVRPTLDIVRSAGGATLLWPTSHPDYLLEVSRAIAPNPFWQDATNPVTRTGRRNSVNIGFEQTNRFFRLRVSH